MMDSGGAEPAERPVAAIGPPKSASCPNFHRVVVAQKTPVWCWAACAEMVNRYHGRRLSQDDIAKRVVTAHTLDTDTQRRAEQIEVLAALEPALYEKMTRRWNEDFADSWLVKFDLMLPDRQTKSGSRVRPALKYNADSLVEHIASRSPVVVGLGGDRESDSRHIVVVHGVEYEPIAPKWDPINGNGPKYRVRKVMYADPDGGILGEMSGDELVRRTNFLATRQAAGQYLNYIHALQIEGEKDANKAAREAKAENAKEQAEDRRKEREKAALEKKQKADVARQGKVVAPKSAAKKKPEPPPQKSKRTNEKKKKD